jgi:hypothetical protein
MTDFWYRLFALPFWPAGPMWFLWVLLVFDAAVAGLFVLFPRMNELVMHLSLYARAQPWKFGAGVLAASAAAYVPLALLFGPLPWGQVGPFSIQLCRPGQYAVYFFTGVVIGASGLETKLIGSHGWPARHWRGAVMAAIAGFGLWLLASAQAMMNPAASPLLHAADAAAYVLACFASCGCALALASRFAPSWTPVWKSLSRNAYGIFLVHFTFAVWLQFALLPMDWPAALKAGFVFVATLALSWVTAAVLGRLPGFAAIIGSGRRTDGDFVSLMHPVVPLTD